ncbi:MAG: proline/glycine betaine ABC transporter substrate-binding protein ProX [Mesorhizobium sp.]|uniref:glycine betaine/L-proline ABC transporter substrate-binding protein ProX n=1 Tax=unclassified Mesorhizobium TaxID=325217 RepID=UPI000FCCBBBF|nr:MULTISPECIES: glycine betaine/L-proline ABC transporter substrate-binding protein ProX [unclassified Mesorhizobium]MCQ8876405.1 glycine betaine/L-proline ABC transporter substrate-binding protein ProX [Mesorhizobium sp. LMG17149]MCT2580985.1 glycine betaine/L-proline ABC transporter substrate-binding protein ProX [Mesorhizobium sp. P13.3]MDF3169752.1 glycine betaine/L-proline ABC transporter substrate-binding protein ProX [Mesorhizobium sp. P16.1]MDF3180582.1 glycine betaine/L-proline ABC tr
MTIKFMMLAIAVMAGYSLPAMADQVKPAWGGETEELFQTFIVDEGLRELGYEVAELSQVGVQLAHTAVANGDLTFYAAHWVPLHDAYWKESGGDEKLVRLGTLIKNCLQGYLIDKKTADATGVKYLEDLRDPEKAKLFDIDGNGKADLYGCDPGWGCERVIEHQLDAYGLRGTVEHRQGGYFAIIPDAIERIKAGKPTLYYTYTPLWVSRILRPGKEVVWLNVKNTSLPDGQTGNTDVQGLGNLGFPVNDQKIIANTTWLNANPKAKKFFELVQIPVEDVNAENTQVANGEKSNEQIMKHATDWIAAHHADWEKWIAEAKAAK